MTAMEQILMLLLVLMSLPTLYDIYRQYRKNSVRQIQVTATYDEDAIEDDDEKWQSSSISRQNPFGSTRPTRRPVALPHILVRPCGKRRMRPSKFT